MHPTRWGDPARAAALPDTARAWSSWSSRSPTAGSRTGRSRCRPAASPTSLGDVAARAWAPSTCSPTTRSRRLRTRGKSTPDLLRARAGDLTDAPDAVVRPADADQVQALLEVAAPAPGRRRTVRRRDVGRRRTGRADARGTPGSLSLDLVRMKRLLAVDPVSMTATLEPGLRGPEAEALLGRARADPRPLPAVVRVRHDRRLRGDPLERPVVGGLRPLRRPGDRPEVATPAGRVVLGHAPASAAGPDLRQLFLGSEGAFGVITVGHRPGARRVPEQKVYEGWRWPSFDAGADAMRTPGPGPAAADGAAPLRRARDRDQPGRPRLGRRRRRPAAA